MKSRSRCVFAPIALAFSIAARPSGRLPTGGRRVRIVEKAQRNAPIGDAAVRVGLEYLLEQFLRLTIPERMLVTHGAIKAPLRNLIAGRLEMNRAQSLISFFLSEERLRE